MSKKQKTLITLSLMAALFGALQLPAGAMHIMEGYLPLGFCVAWGALSLPFIAAGFVKIRKIVSANRKTLLILAMAGAFTFVLSALKIPSVTGSSSHPTGTGLGAILFGPAPMAVLGSIVLLFQAILLAHGGLTTLGANIFSMAIAGPFVAYFIYKLCKKLKFHSYLAVGLAATLGDLATYCITSIQLGLAHPSATGGMVGSMMEFFGIFAVTQVPVAIIEGILTVIVIIGLEKSASEELDALGFERLPDPGRHAAAN